ncbi:hypothetical protein BAY32_08025 [Elizabethkingia ursingii]|uniref:Uncharacterized protein n=1 Tax=Elizabethkingia ursingii TaxID=1756150 RepID=A0AAJ3NB90_9FLAO|nr:hypothetical protein BBD34_12165 [Elizabethkingia ursingii]OPB74279.1 hypothetical protein BAY32_08025 [Elizabethkingia ursingii]
MIFKLFINSGLRVFLDYGKFNGYTLWVYKSPLFKGDFLFLPPVLPPEFIFFYNLKLVIIKKSPGKKPRLTKSHKYSLNEKIYFSNI